MTTFLTTARKKYHNIGATFILLYPRHTWTLDLPRLVIWPRTCSNLSVQSARTYPRLSVDSDSDSCFFGYLKSDSHFGLVWAWEPEIRRLKE